MTLDDMIVAPATYADPATYDALFTGLRRDDPVHWTEPQGYRPFWSITKLADIQEVERQADLFLNAPRLLLRPAALEEQIKAATGGSAFMLRDVVHMDGTDHRAHRRLTQAWFMPGRLKALQGDLHDLARIYIDRMIAAGSACDFVEDVAIWYPLRVIMRILGVPESDEALMLTLTQDLFGSDDPDRRRGRARPDLATTIQRFMDYFTELTDRRRRDPSDDLATLLSVAEVDGEPIGTLELMSYYIVIATAGHDTTSSTISGGVLALIQNPEQMRRLRAEPELMLSAIDEMVRWVSPVKHFFRTATVDYELRGKTIRAGDNLMMCYPSANRDEDAFDDPFDFDVGRQPKHIGFGYGPHLCLGQHLAKMEMRIFFEELLARVDDFQLAGAPAWVASNFLGGLKRLPITYTVREEVETPGAIATAAHR